MRSNVRPETGRRSLFQDDGVETNRTSAEQMAEPLAVVTLVA
ncbi:MAG TPA: hypothetical protein VFO63_04830 [Blastocatellia bacterium]|nr:hypothetical protein [Blastocatellia bacterium]